jgi:hypothetical protein
MLTSCTELCVPSIINDVACSLGKVVVSLGGIRGQPEWAQVGSSQRCYVYEFWQVQDGPDA